MSSSASAVTLRRVREAAEQGIDLLGRSLPN